MGKWHKRKREKRIKQKGNEGEREMIEKGNREESKGKTREK